MNLQKLHRANGLVCAQRLILVLAFLFAFPLLLHAQGGVAVSGIVVLGPTGRPVAGASVSVCTSAGTGFPCTPLASIFSDPGLTIPLPNPTTTDGLGNLIVYASPGVYKYTVTGSGISATGQPYTATVAGSGGGNAVTGGPNAFTGNNTFAGTTALNGGGILSGTFSGNSTLSGNLTATTGQNILSAYNINNILTVDGIKYATLAAAFADCPTAGCVIDMRGNPTALTLGTFDPGTKAVTLLLGPYTYTVNQITLESNFQLFGSGANTGLGGTPPATVLQAIGSNTTPPFVIAQVAGVASVKLENFRLFASVGNTSQNGISLVASASGGLWYSAFDNLQLFNFKGISVNLDSQSLASINQFDTFNRVLAFRPNLGSFALRIIGYANSLKFNNCEFDGTFNTQDGQTNIWIGQGSQSTFVPYDIKFDLLTSQYAGMAVVINGGDTISFDQGHFELVEQVLTVGSGAGFGSLNVTMHDSGFFTNSGIGTVGGIGLGNGYIVKVVASTANASVGLISTHALQVPDNWMTGNTGSIVSYNNIVGPEGSYTQVASQPGGPNGFGTGAAGTAVTTTTKGGGTGPTTPQTIVKYIQVTLSGVVFWIPLVQ